MKYLSKTNVIKKTKLLNQYQTMHGNITNLCRYAGINRTTFYDWLEADAGFAQAVQEAEMGLNDELREVLVKRAGEGATAELIFYLKHRHPDFKEHYQTNIQINVVPILGKEIKAE